MKINSNPEAIQFIKQKNKLSLITQLVSTIQNLHNKGLIHRDIKTQNIFLKKIDNIFIPILGDFGFSSKISDFIKCKKQKIQTYGGTLDYMAPQLLKFQDYTQKVDMWGLGAVFYQILTYDLKLQKNKQIYSRQKLIKTKPIYKCSNEQIIKLQKQIPEKINKLQKQFNEKQINFGDFFIKLLRELLKQNPNQRINSYDALKFCYKFKENMQNNNNKQIQNSVYITEEQIKRIQEQEQIKIKQKYKKIKIKIKKIKVEQQFTNKNQLDISISNLTFNHQKYTFKTLSSDIISLDNQNQINSLQNIRLLQFFLSFQILNQLKQMKNKVNYSHIINFLVILVSSHLQSLIYYNSQVSISKFLKQINKKWDKKQSLFQYIQFLHSQASYQLAESKIIEQSKKFLNFCLKNIDQNTKQQSIISFQFNSVKKMLSLDEIYRKISKFLELYDKQIQQDKQLLKVFLFFKILTIQEKDESLLINFIKRLEVEFIENNQQW